MALNSAALKSDIVSALQGHGFVLNDASKFDALADAIATAVVDHIKSMGVVNVTVAVSTPNGPGTGTGVGTMS
jgi:hypothetical protein